ncbi:TlpA family protein disulfide reductase [Salegentibacter salinarum]|nr:TlpA disulfide reductase family protein [Salegentibacter salinarum]
MIESDDSVIQPFKYDLRVGKEYLMRSNSYDKIGMKIPAQKFELVGGDEIIIGGKANKPTLINLWFTSCGGCIQEMPVLNELKVKYAEKVNFIAMTFNEAEEVSEFLEKRKFNFRHVTDARDFIGTIKSYPYPENIFIDKNGVIKYIEQGASVRHFESIIDELLEPKAVAFTHNK